MFRGWRRLLAGGLLGAVVSLMVDRNRQRRKAVGRSSLLRWMGPFLSVFLGEMGKEGIWRKLLPLRRRMR